jgi:flagellar hook-basal body complex protein FliE
MALDKISNPALVANLYSSTQKAADASSGGESAVSFGDLMKAGVKEAVGSLKAGEAASAAAVTGKADLSQVVQAITKAEMTLQTVVAVRDRMMSAYQEILRMPI